MHAKLLNKGNILNGGVVELFTIEGLFYVKSNVKGTIKFSDCLSEFKAKYLMFKAIEYGDLSF